MKTKTLTLTNKELQLLNAFLDFLGDGLAEDHIFCDIDFFKIFNKKEQKQIAAEVYESSKDIYEDFKPQFEDLAEFDMLFWLKDKIKAQTNV